MRHEYSTTCPFNNFLNKCSVDIQGITKCLPCYYYILSIFAKHGGKLLFMKEVHLTSQNMILISNRCVCFCVLC